jgi:SNF2 family DNA or RNA helicase
MNSEDLINRLLTVEIKRKPYQHQIDALKLFYDKPNAFLFWEMGTGKTGGAILLHRLRCIQAGVFLPTVVITPIVTITNWKNEYSLFSQFPEHRIKAITGSNSKSRLKKMGDLGEDILIINYEALSSDEIRNKILDWGPTIVIVDEAHKIKSHDADRTKYVTQICDKAAYKIFMSGTPILNSIVDLYSPFRALDGGETFGKSRNVFLNTYMYDANARMKTIPGVKYFPDWKPRPEKFDEITQKIYAKANRKLKSECLDLPPLVEVVEYVGWGVDQKKAYDEMKRDFLTFVKTKSQDTPLAVVAELALTKALRLLQIASGFVVTEDKAVIEFNSVPRLDKLSDLLLDLTPNHKVIVWSAYVHNYRMIERLCRQHDIKYVMLTGEQSTGEKDESIASFQSDNSVRVIIANRRAGGIGINLTAASYSIVFSRNFSLEDEEQSKARNYRGGSEIHERIVKIDLAIENSIDDECLKALKSKQSLSTRIIDLKEDQL